jgi:hypothetical protein
VTPSPQVNLAFDRDEECLEVQVMTFHAAVAVLLAATSASWADDGRDDLEEAAKQEENHLSGIVNLQLRNNTSYLIGPFERSRNVLQLRATLPLRLGSWVTLNTFFIVPLVWNPDVTTPHDTAFGLGDITLELPFTMTFREIIFVALGPDMLFPTANDNRLGSADTGKFSSSPSDQPPRSRWHRGLGSSDWRWTTSGRWPAALRARR